MGINIRRKSQNGGIRAVISRLKDLEKHAAHVGWVDGAQYDNGTPVAYIASIQEWGAPSAGIPPRPFIRPACDKNRKDWIRIASLKFRDVLMGKDDAANAYTAIGATASSDIQVQISNTFSPALSPVTIAARAYKNKGGQINRTVINEIRFAVATGKTGKGQLGDQSFGNTKPLQDTGFMLASCTFLVTDNET